MTEKYVQMGKSLHTLAKLIPKTKFCFANPSISIYARIIKVQPANLRCEAEIHWQ